VRALDGAQMSTERLCEQLVSIHHHPRYVRYKSVGRNFSLEPT